MDRESNSFAASNNGHTSFFYTLEKYQNVVVDLADRQTRDTRYLADVVIVEYAPMLFGSLFARTPREEFRLVFDALHLDTKNISSNNADEALLQWGLEDFADTNFHELSGGYRKYVFIATQIEARKRGERVVAVNIQQQLDVKRFRTIEQKFLDKGISSVLWVDDDPVLLTKKSRVPAKQITLNEWL